jgi:hypothetical protein
MLNFENSFYTKTKYIESFISMNGVIVKKRSMNGGI